MNYLARQWRALAIAVQFLTTLPSPGNRATDKASDVAAGSASGSSADVAAENTIDTTTANESQALSLLWYPAVGLLLGALLTLACAALPLPFYVQAVVTVVLWVVLTGGLHLDGVADCADAWVGGLGDRDKTLRLLKDPLCGSMGVLALIIVLALKATALAAVLQHGQLLWLWSVPLLARGSLLLLFLTTPYVRPQGLGEVLARHFSRRWAFRVLLGVALALLFVLPLDLWGLLLAAVLVISHLVRTAAMRRLGGFTGDVAGAQVELVEVGLLLLLACRSVV